MSLRLLIGESETLLAELLGAHLQEIFPGAQVICVRTVQELAEVSAEHFDLAIVDLLLADGNALAWLQARVTTHSPGRIIVLTACDKEVLLHSLLKTGAAGIIHKVDGLAFLEMALKTVSAGGSVFSPKIQEIRNRLHADPNFFAKILSPREQAILAGIGDGLDTHAIARKLGIKDVTVSDHRKNVMAKLGLHSAAELVAYTLAKGFGSHGRWQRRRESGT